MHINNLNAPSPPSTLHTPIQTEMAKRFKLRFSMPTFQLCRSKNPFSFPKTPALPAPTYLYSPVNPKALEITYPNFPDPPPTTPTNNHHNCTPFSKPRHHSSKISPLKSSSNLQPNPHKTCNSPISFNSDSLDNLPISPPSKHKREKKLNITPADSSSEETTPESLFSSSTSFDASSFDFISNYNGCIKKTSKNVKARKLKRYASNKWKLGKSSGSSSSSSSESSVVVENNDNSKSSGVKKSSSSSSSVLGRLMGGCAVEGKVKESFAVVTKSEDPYEDFKRSMLEMILEKKMFEAKELEELLHCFLSLNSQHHHAVIVAAFTEIWEVLFL